MTTGLKQIGATSSTLYFYRSWTGTDGKNVPAKIPSTIHRIRDPRGVPTIVARPEYFDRDGGWHGPYEIVKWPYITIERKHFVPSKDTWNDYTVTICHGTASLGTSGRYIDMSYCWTAGYSWTSNDELALLGKLSDSVRGHSFNLGIAVAEGSQTIHMVSNTVLRLASAVRSLKKGRIDLALRSLGATPRPEHRDLYRNGRPTKKGMMYSDRLLVQKDISGVYLELQYGWMPLINDVYESMNAYSAITDKPRKMRYVVTLSRSKHIYTPASIYVDGWSTQSDATLSKRIIYEATEKLSVARSLGLVDPRSVVWEIIPFSFVADWFIPIGAYLDALAVIPALEGRFLTTSHYYRRGVCIGNNKGFGFFRTAKCQAKQINIQRTSSTSLSVPKPVFKSLDKALSPVHIKNALALLHQLVT